MKKIKDFNCKIFVRFKKGDRVSDMYHKGKCKWSMDDVPSWTNILELLDEGYEIRKIITPFGQIFKVGDTVTWGRDYTEKTSKIAGFTVEEGELVVIITISQFFPSYKLKYRCDFNLTDCEGWQKFRKIGK
jgi:hypothetical protein